LRVSTWTNMNGKSDVMGLAKTSIGVDLFDIFKFPSVIWHDKVVRFSFLKQQTSGKRAEALKNRISSRI